MTKEEIQKTWDDCLVRGWKSDIRMTDVMKHFLLDINPSLLKLGGVWGCEFNDIKESIDYISSLEIKRRCRDRMGDGTLSFQSVRGCVRAFIANRSQHMSNCLLAGEASADEVLESISGFKWSRLQYREVSKIKQRNLTKLKRARGVKTIMARSLDKKHDWKTVK